MTIQEVIRLYKSVYYLEDDGIIPLAVAVALSGRLEGDPLWLMVVGPSSGGKSEIINAIDGVPWVSMVSTLTANTFLSGMKNGDQETSLLKRIGNGTIAFKDFTTLLSMPRDLQQQLFAQLREIFDGRMVKETGQGNRIEWIGKISLIAGVTEAIHSQSQRFAGMGTRALMYTMPDQDRLDTARRAQENVLTIKAKRLEVQAGFSEYMLSMVQDIPKPLPTVSEEEKSEMLELANFASLARSPVERGFKDDMQLVLSAEMPMRMAGQMYMMASIFTWMYGSFTEECRKIIIKVALDSIPKQRRISLRLLAEYAKVSTKGMAVHLHYPTNTIRQWLEDCCALGLCDREAKGGQQGDYWTIKEEYRAFMEKYDNVVPGTLWLEAEKVETELDLEDLYSKELSTE